MINKVKANEGVISEGPAPLNAAAVRGFASHDDFRYLPNLAFTASELGDGKETDCETDHPYRQTNPTLFAAPHAFALDRMPACPGPFKDVAA